MPFVHTRPEDITFDPKPECEEEVLPTNQVPFINSKSLKEILTQGKKFDNE